MIPLFITPDQAAMLLDLVASYGDVAAENGAHQDRDRCRALEAQLRGLAQTNPLIGNGARNHGRIDEVTLTPDGGWREDGVTYRQEMGQ